MSTLFDAAEADNRRSAEPLASRMRPRTLAEFVGQQHFLGPDCLLRRLIQARRLGSVIFYGPPGTGKTTLAHLLAEQLQCHFCKLSAVTSGVAQLRTLLDHADDRLAAAGEQTLLFIDEIHRFNRAQQDALLPDVERGVVVLVGATTSNPFFAINDALISRSRLFEFRPLESEEVIALLRRALTDCARGLGEHEISADAEALQFLAEQTDGDARRALSALEIGALSLAHTATAQGVPRRFTRSLAAESLQQKAIAYDPKGDGHYDAASALIKSIRGSDPDASLYWLARMLEAGDDIRFICRRIVILASEDIGNADPQALPLAVATAQACELVGLPECQLTLAQTVTYLACAPKSNAATKAIAEARSDVQQKRLLPVPRHLQDAHYAGAQRLGRGQGYQYAHDADGGVAAQDYLGVEREYYHPTDRGFEDELSRRLKSIRATLRSAKQAPDDS